MSVRKGDYMNKTLEQLIESLDTIPFLLVGSGLSRRYYNLPDWTELLKVMVAKLNKDSFAYRSYENRASSKIIHMVLILK